MNNLEFAAAGEERLAVRRETQAVERLRYRDTACDALPLALQANDHDFVLAIAGMQRSQPLALGVQREIDGEITQRDLLAGGAQRPLVGQTNFAARLDTGQNPNASGR